MDRKLACLFLKAANDRHTAARQEAARYSSSLFSNHVPFTDEVVARYKELDAKVDRERARRNRWIEIRCMAEGVSVPR